MDVFTSITLNYLPKARILASTLKGRHPDWTFHLCVSDRKSPDRGPDTAREPFDRLIWIEDLNIPNLYQWIFKHSIVEICTAIKGAVALSLLDRGAEKVMYLDPDIAVFNPLDEIERLLDQYPVILTPHMLEFENTRKAIVENEICTLRHGVFNLGFFAVNNGGEGKRFADWFSRRLLEFCYDDIPNGLFTDQRWCDLAPVFFPNLYIHRDPGCNTASWNLSKRSLSFSQDGTLLVNGSPLKFYHFTGYDSGWGDTMTREYSGGNTVVSEIWTWYRHQLEKQGQRDFGKLKWDFDFFDDGEKISQPARLLYRESERIRDAFPNPFAVDEEGGYRGWYRANISGQCAGAGQESEE